MRKKETNEFVVYVDGSLYEPSYSKAIKRILKNDMADEVLVSFYGMDNFDILAELKTLPVNDKDARVLILNENSSVASRKSALKTLIKIKDNPNFKHAIENQIPVKLVCSY